MERFRKILPFLLMVCIFVFACTAAFANSKETTPDKYEAFFSEEDILESWGPLTEEEQMDYAGVYIDGDSVVLLFKEGTESLKNAITRNDQNNRMLINPEKQLKQALEIKAATYSYNELMAVYNYLIEEAYSLDGVYSISLSNKGNCVNIGVSSDVQASDIQEKLYAMLLMETTINNFADGGILSFHSVLPENELSYVASINGNSQLQTIYVNPIHEMSYSAAVGHYSSTYGAGFITTGHAPAVGDAVRYNLSIIGYVKEVHHDGSDDTAFVQFSGSNSWQSITTQHEEKVSAVPAEGVTISLRGYLTTPYANAEVISNTFSYQNQQDGITWSDLILADYGVSEGDSGGAAYWGTIDHGRTTRVIGVISAAGNSATCVVKASNIANY